MSAENYFSGPTAKELIYSENILVYLAWIIGVFPFLITIIITIKFHVSLSKASVKSSQHHRYIVMGSLPLIYALCCGLSLFMVRLSLLLDAIRHIYEALALNCFMGAIIVLHGGKNEMLNKLYDQDPRKYLRAPPCTLCCYCLPTHRFNKSTYKFIYLTIRQYIFIVPTLAIIKFILYITDSRITYITIIDYINVCSTLLIFQGMQTLYRGCRDIISEYRPGWKFWTLRAAILVSVIQGFAFEFLRVTRIKDFNIIKDTDLMSRELLSGYLNNFLLTVESPLLSYLITKSYTLSDLEKLFASKAVDLKSISNSKSSQLEYSDNLESPTIPFPLGQSSATLDG